MVYANFVSVPISIKEITVMKDAGKVVATTVIWGSVAFLSYLFHSFGILNGIGAAWLVGAAVFLTVGFWSS